MSEALSVSRVLESNRDSMSDTSRPTSPQQDLWSSILDSVSSTRSIPSKNVLILGEPSTGKSTLSNALLQKTVDHNDHKDGEWSGKSDFAIGYEWGNVKDDGEEGEETHF